MKTHPDIDPLIAELANLHADPGNKQANELFAQNSAQQVITLLEELKKWREQEDHKHTSGSRVLIEGYDADCMKNAFRDALNKASRFFNEHHDISITVAGLQSLKHGGHRALLEVDIVPLSGTLTSHPAALEGELKHIRQREYESFKKKESLHIQELVHDHFLEISGLTPHVPDYFLINFKDADLLNHMIEKEFFNAGGSHGDNQETPEQALIRIIKDHDRS